jgi:hypothetical protein
VNVRSDSSTSEGKNQVNEEYLPKKRIRLLVAYNVLLAILVSAALLLVVAFAPYPKSQAGQSMSLANVETALFPTIVITALFTMLIAGALGGTLCNLRGLFKQIERNKGRFPAKFEVPFYIRPLTGTVTGLFTFFLSNLINSSLSNASDLGWQSLEGRLPYIAMALLAGFAAQEFMERLKEVAKTLFSENTRNEVIPQMESLATLHNAGALTDDEFMAAKAKLLEK